MRPRDLIVHLATQEGRRVTPLRSSDEHAAQRAPCSLAYVCVEDAPSGRGIHARGIGHAGHDNAARMPFVCAFLNAHVLPYVEDAGAVRGVYPIELHDTYTYLRDHRGQPADPDADDRIYAGALVFSRAREHGGPAVFPDPFQMCAYGGALNARDTIPWERKKPRMFFAGTSTGSHDPMQNARVRACVWSLNHRDVADFRITRIAQMNAATAFRRVPELTEIISSTVPADAHTAYRIGVNVPGNTCSWSRVPEVLASRTVLFDFLQGDVQWYSPALQDGVHYASVDYANLLQTYARYVNDVRACTHMCDHANRFVDAFLRPVHAAQYAKRLLETAAHYRAP